jgi:hypothetical protein
MVKPTCLLKKNTDEQNAPIGFHPTLKNNFVRMKSNISMVLLMLLWCIGFGNSSCIKKETSVQEVMNRVISQLYKTAGKDELEKLDNDKVMALFSAEDKEVLSTKHWMFDANVPVIVSVMRSKDQKTIPFWLETKGFKNTGMTMKNEHCTYEIWQKSFPAGRVGLGIHGFDNAGLHYFVSVGPQNKNDQVKLTNFFPENQFVGVTKDGAFTYHDWDELVLSGVPSSMVGQQLLTTIRGRASETHLIGAFRSTEHPSSAKPDQLLLTWSDDPSTSMDIQWRTDTTVTEHMLKYREKGSSQTLSADAERVRMDDRMLMNDRSVNHFTAKLRNLKPGVTYQYLIAPQTEWTDNNSFTTAAKDNSYSFLWFGDTHFSPKYGEILHLAVSDHPDAAFYSIVGDLVSDGLHRDQWDNLLDYSKDVICRYPLMAVPGNHDNREGLGAKTFRDIFSYPENAPAGVPKEQTYSFTYKNTLFLMIDATSPIAAQTPWIDQQLATTNAKWKIAMFHFPPYNWEEPYVDIQKAWVPLFDKYHVDMVLGGHIHYYMRSKPMKAGKVVSSYKDGTAYIISIGIPQKHFEITNEPYAEVLNTDGQLYQYIKIEDGSLSYESVAIDHKINDSFKIKK